MNRVSTNQYNLLPALEGGYLQQRIFDYRDHFFYRLGMGNQVRIYSKIHRSPAIGFGLRGECQDGDIGASFRHKQGSPPAFREYRDNTHVPVRSKLASRKG